MVETYSINSFSVQQILGYIAGGDFVVPEIQRPFVWKKIQVRDLIDSLYHGYPIGYIITWQNHDVKLKNGEKSQGKKILIDGQQRITALMSAISGLEVVNDDFKKERIRIAFNPLAEDGEKLFEVQTPAIKKDKRWVADISDYFKAGSSLFALHREYLELNPGANEELVFERLNKLEKIAGERIGVIELDASLDIDVVTEIFIRINSKGTSLNQSDFVMSKIAADENYGGNMLRKAIDYFCHLAAKPEFFEQMRNDTEFVNSEYYQKLAWLRNDNETIYDPDYGDMLRVAFMHQFGRGKLTNLVSLLSGRDFETREYREEIAEETYQLLDVGIRNFMQEDNFKQYLRALKDAGFINEKLAPAKMNLDFAYTLLFLLKNDPQISKQDVSRYVQKWYVLSVVTGRYGASPESSFDRDLRQIKEKGFLKVFEEVEASELSDTFWEVTLPQKLESSSTQSPQFHVYLASLIYRNSASLLKKGTPNRNLIEIKGDVHHIFPKSYLRKHGVTERSKYNQIANYTYLDTQVNIAIGDKSPNVYFKEAFEQCTTKEVRYGDITNLDVLKKNLAENCVPESVLEMDYTRYDEFLEIRRKLMAESIHEYYESL